MRVERFDAFVERSLYGADGFYSSGRGAAGRRGGDFVTSAETGPLFGAVLANRIDEWWRGAGRPEAPRVVDLGAGPGTLARSLALAEVPVARHWTIESVDRATGAGPTPPAELLRGAVVVANELLDNVAFRWVRKVDGGWHEVWLADGRPAWDEVDRATVARLEAVPSIRALEPGAEFPWCGGAADLIAGVLAAGPALLIVFDYGAPTTGALARRGGWLRTYAGHGRGDDPFDRPGHIDITTDVPFDQLPAPSSLRAQAQVMRAWGIEDLVAEGRRRWEAAAARPDLTAMRMRSRISEADALLAPDGLGAFWCAEWEHPSGGSA